MPLTLDANLWVAAYDPKDHFYTSSISFLRTLSQQEIPLYAPAFLPLEAACALTRRTQNSTTGISVYQLLNSHPLMQLIPLDTTLLTLASQLGIQQKLRGADAFYVATAHLTQTPLITWDNELIHRSQALTPQQWQAPSNPQS